ncbi:MAG TPA: MFS transporter, partial [Chondromyces sp.]|nr:MFS transporter [Chondromyces sp.]
MTNIETRLWTLCFSQILINTLLFFLCMHMLNASFPVFIIEKGHDPATGGMMTTAFMLAAIFTRPFVSVFLHRMNMKKIMFITLILLFFCVLMSFNRDLIPLLLLIRVLEGVGF